MSPIIQLLRPKQWIKNAFVVAPIFFAQALDDLQAWRLIILAFIAFTCAASVVYIINDIVDCKEDATHPVKSHRPLAAGKITLYHAMGVAFFALILCGLFLLILPPQCAWLIGFYIVSNMLYTLVLKKQALLDVFFIAGCFVIRVLVGCAALSVMVSPWIILTTFMLALFLGFGKRYHELGIEGYAKSKHNLQHYSHELLDKLVIISAAAALISYALYTVEMTSITGNVNIVYTVAFVAFGLFRYLQFIYVFNQGGEPEDVIISDRWQWINLVLWLGFTVWVI